MSEMKAQEAQQRVSVCDQRAVEQSRLAEDLTIKVIAYTLPLLPHVCTLLHAKCFHVVCFCRFCHTRAKYFSLDHTPFH